MSITGNRTDWTFFTSPGYNELDVKSDTDDVRTGSTGERSLRIPVSPLAPLGTVDAVLTGQASVEASEATVEFWIKNEDIENTDFEATFGVRVAVDNSSGTKAFIGLKESSYGAVGFHTIEDGYIKCKASFPETQSEDWVKARVSTSDVNGAPSFLLEVLDGGVLKKRAYLVDNTVMAAATEGFYSFGIRNIDSDAASAIRFDDVNLFLSGLEIETPLPYSVGFENASWTNNYTGHLLESEDLVRTLKADARPESDGTYCLDITNGSSVDTLYSRLDIAICDGAERSIELWVKFIDTYSPLEIELKKIQEAASGDEQSYVLKISLDSVTPANSDIELLRRTALGDTAVDSDTATLTTGTWYGFRLTLTEDASVEYLVEYNTGDSSPVSDDWTTVLSGTDADSPLFGIEGYASIYVDVDPDGSVRFDDITTDKA